MTSKCADPDQVLTLSVVVPAFNEQALLARTLTGLCSAVAQAGLNQRQVEIIVCDNASTDNTASIARAHGAKLVLEPHRQISRARNSGAARATGRFLLFVDADTWPDAALIRETVLRLDRGDVCGGGTVLSSAGLSLMLRGLLAVWNISSRLTKVACGAYLFCERTAFVEVGGFSLELYAAEELELSRRLRRWGQKRGKAFQIITAHPLRTSMRKLELYRPGELVFFLARAIMHPLRALKDRRYLDPWYDGRR